MYIWSWHVLVGCFNWSCYRINTNYCGLAYMGEVVMEVMINDVVEHKKRLEHNITNMVKYFERSHGIAVTGIHVLTAQEINNQRSEVTSIDIEVTL